MLGLQKQAGLNDNEPLLRHGYVLSLREHLLNAKNSFISKKVLDFALHHLAFGHFQYLNALNSSLNIYD
jgi:hypothetical protein